MLVRMRFLPALLLLAATPIAAQSFGPWQLEPSETTADLRGIHAVGGGVVWASGSEGTVLRSQDSGFEWQQCATPTGAEKLDFRAIWAWDDQTAVVMSSGPGALSRLYETTDGCAHWTLLYTNADKDGFFDAMVFQTRMKGYLLGDPVDGRFVLLATDDGGQSWKRSEAPGLGVATSGSGAFAASNTSLLAGPREPMIFGTGGGFVYAQSHTGKIDFSATGKKTPIRMTETWAATRLPMTGGTTAGVFSLGYHALDSSGYGYTLVAVGGDYARPHEVGGTAAWSPDGQHWTAATTPPGGYRSAVAWSPEIQAWITVGPNGSDISRDGGRTWQPLEHAPANTPKGGEWNALSLPWVVGPHGRIAKLNPEALDPAPPAPKARSVPK